MDSNIVAALLVIASSATGATLIMTVRLLLRFVALETTVGFIKDDVAELKQQKVSP
jgi:hypothetical protein